MAEIIGRDMEAGRPVRVSIEEATITSVEQLPFDPSQDLPWIAPALWDLQVNGGWGVSFSSPGLTVEDVIHLAECYARQGVARFCPTLITASPDDTQHALRVLDQACRSNTWLDNRVLGVHLEGPWISEIDGYRGAHAIEWVRDPDWAYFERLQEASGGRIVLVTLAPERPGAIDMILRLTAQGVAVALGHTAADRATIHAAVVAGAKLSTHLGNGIASPLPRHPNPIWEQAADDRLFASFIADLKHVDAATLRVLTRTKSPARTILVSDLSPLAGCEPGRYHDWEVLDDGTVVVAGTDYLAGASRSLLEGLCNLVTRLDWSLIDAVRSATQVPASLLGQPVPNIGKGQRADLIMFQSFEVNEGNPSSSAYIGGRVS